MYALLDSGEGRKLERFGSYILERPASQAVWKPQHDDGRWDHPSASFTRDGSNQWICTQPLPESWKIDVGGVTFKLMPTDFGHLGIFPEQLPWWEWIRSTLKKEGERLKRAPKLLNLFAYSGGATLAAAQGGAHVCHLDASRPTIAWARENSALNGLREAPIRWICDDAIKFLNRELKRGQRYDAIVLDPPSFGRGPEGELFKIEEQISQLLQQCKALLSDEPLFLLFSCHTPGFSPIVMEFLLKQTLGNLKGTIDAGELTLSGPDAYPLPSGTFARWSRE